MNKSILAFGLLFIILLVSCTPATKPTQPPQSQPTVGGGCGVQGLPPNAMQDSSCEITKTGMHCTAKAGL